MKVLGNKVMNFAGEKFFSLPKNFFHSIRNGKNAVGRLPKILN